MAQSLDASGDTTGLKASYTRDFAAFVADLQAIMTVSDLADLTRTNWDTIKNIVKARLETRVGQPPSTSHKDS